MLSRRTTLLLRYHIDFMRSVPEPEHFDMATWAAHHGDAVLCRPTVHDQPIDGAGPRLLNDCGMTACAGGWAAACPAFQQLGLVLNAYPTVDGTYAIQPMYGLFDDGWDAVREFFGLTEMQADFLFSNGSRHRVRQPTTPAEWAALAEEFLAEHGPAPLSRLDRLQLWCGYLPRLT